MRVYSISKWAFRGICLLIIILPISRHWKLLTTGQRANGTVTAFVMHEGEMLIGEGDLVYVSEITFEVNGTLHKTFGPSNYEYNTGRNIKVFYNSGNPSHHCIATISGFYLTGYTVLPVILLVVWAAFYMSFNNYRRKQRFKKGAYGRSAGSKRPGVSGAGAAIGGPIQSARRITGSKVPPAKK